jgi:hypothetical protein
MFALNDEFPLLVQIKPSRGRVPSPSSILMGTSKPLTLCSLMARVFKHRVSIIVSVRLGLLLAGERLEQLSGRKVHQLAYDMNL